jgi:GT2 family glycosyltransferase
MSEGDAPLVRAVLLNWNDRSGTERCLERLGASEGVHPDVLVVDNGSAGGDAAFFRGRLGSHRVLALPENRGYAGGMNAGLRFWREREGRAPILLVTPDARVAPDALRRLLEELERTPGAGLVGPLVVYSDEPERIGAGGVVDADARRAYLIRKVAGDGPHDVDWIDGCCMLIRPGALEDVGELDERYFAYFEETDYCERARRAGWSVRLVPAAVVEHPKIVGTLPPYYFYYMARNRYLFWEKNFDIGWPRIALQVAGQTARAWASVVRDLVTPARRSLWRGHLRDARLQLRGAVRGTADHLRGRHGPMPSGRMGPRAH